MGWDVQFRAGVWLPQVAWWLDAHFPVGRSFVSHAHADHIAPHREILCSAGTARLMRARVAGERIEHVLPFGQAEQLTPDCTVELHPAGHIFGSAQALLTHHDHGSLLYTGDFKLRPGRSAEPCATPRAGTLIMETTFGRPAYVFPPTAQVLADIAAFCHGCLDDGETPVLFAYSLGKSQELLCGLADAHLPVMLHPQALRLTRLYAQLGMAMPPCRPFAAEEAAGHVVICPPQSPGSAFLRSLPRRRTAVISGWAVDPGAVHRYQCDAAFPLSDHADFPDLLRFVEAVQPRRVLTLHGFAQEFARTLRERGVEAWAVGEDNQLEFGLATTPARVAPPAEPARPEPPAAATTPTPEGGFALLTRTAERVKGAVRRRDKVALLQAYLAPLGPDEAAQAALFLSGRALPPHGGRPLQLGWALIKRAVLAVAGVAESEYQSGHYRFADAGDATAALLAGRTRSAGLGLADLAGRLAELAGARSPAVRLEQLEALLRRLSPAEAGCLVRITQGDLRIGLKESLLEEAVAAAAGQDADAVRSANLVAGDIAEVTRAALSGRLGEIGIRPFHPLHFMLATPEPTAAALLARLPAPVWLEEKYDGIRCQLHRAGGRVELYSRELRRLTSQFPDLAAAAARLPGDVIIDGELLAWREGRALPFASLQRRLGRSGDDLFLGAEIPVGLSCYDLLWRDGRSLIGEPLRARRGELAAVLAGEAAGSPLTLAPVRLAHTVVEVEAAFLAARQRGNEGLMAKDPASLYTPGRRGLSWLKLKKAYATLDVVVVAVEYGHGRRRDVLSDYTFAVRDPAGGDQLLAVGKAYSGLTDAEIATLTGHFLAQTVEVRGRRRIVVPDTVLEVAFDAIQPSDRHASGFALRFPRIVRLRPDKTPAEIDTLATCRSLAAGSFAASSTPS